MLSRLFVAVAAAALAAAQELKLAKSYTGWDCCKPVCAGNVNQNILETKGVIKTCRATGETIPALDGMSAPSGCQSGNGNAGFLCSDMVAQPVSDQMAYGFAIEVGNGGDTSANNPSCCKCYELEWLTGAAADADRKMTVQIVTPGQAAGDIKSGDIILLAPGGGVGPFGAGGCQRQWGNGFNWGPQFGGITKREDCEGLPPNLQGGCYWRFNWAGGEVNGWDIVYKHVECPARLSQISGCAAPGPSN